MTVPPRGAASVSWHTQDAQLLLTLANDRDAFDATRQAVLDFLNPYAPSEQALFNIELILEESLMNVIWHAFSDQADHRIDLLVQVDPQQIVLRFEDDGIAFDPLQASEPVLPTSLDDAVPGGLGLMLVRKFAKSVAYERSGDRNRLTIAVART
jgi:anti-sigma regulatory factor (Ser/Thr protein kinase)